MDKQIEESGLFFTGMDLDKSNPYMKYQEDCMDKFAIERTTSAFSGIELCRVKQSISCTKDYYSNKAGKEAEEYIIKKNIYKNNDEK